MTSRLNQTLTLQSRNEKVIGKQVTLSLQSMQAASFNQEEMKVELTAEDLTPSPLKVCGGGADNIYHQK